MPKNTIERRHDIIQTAADAGRVQVPELVEKYGVSAVTIRGDLNYLHKKGLLVRTHGGAVASNRVSQELSVQEKVTEHLDIKRRLAEAAVSEIREQDTIILDSGTTTAEIARRLRDFERLLVMTNGLNVAQQLLDAEGVEVLMTGGTLRKKSLSFYGRPAEEMLRCYHFDKVFLGVDGIDFQGGITTHFEYEANLNRLMCKVARQVIAVTDSSKFNRSGVHKICDFADIDILITDAGIPHAFHQAIADAGVEVVIVD
ncbi:transcriptional repressor AgaR [Microbulbifer taiwanensis]|uniref:Transcriptional repressor AgaR n=1 Tax=Microbulbifer taiwanensis TaxID=986746 RepID=A0ABW1YTV2_9GAMM|nr:transcriptional repressor AgaR [Microbulbifer taiwanensis]